MFLAQLHFPSLAFTQHGAFAGVNLESGGQLHGALIGRTFLSNFLMLYDGMMGSVSLFR